jgi:hypothetical protein
MQNVRVPPLHGVVAEHVANPFTIVQASKRGSHSRAFAGLQFTATFPSHDAFG